MGDTPEDFQHGYWIRNRKVWNIQPGERIRPLPGQKKHVFDYAETSPAKSDSLGGASG